MGVELGSTNQPGDRSRKIVADSVLVWRNEKLRVVATPYDL